MPNAVELTKAIKRAAVDAVNALNLVEIRFGKVIGASPLKILIEQKMTLGEAQLILCRNVTDYKTYISENAVESESGDFGEDSAAEGDKKEVVVHNGLETGDEVILIRVQGGQKYVVLDKIG